jgi:hypothetical protein
MGRSSFAGQTNDLDKLLCDDGSDGDYAPDVLNPYSIRFSMDPSEYIELLTDKMREVHEVRWCKLKPVLLKAPGSSDWN